VSDTDTGIPSAVREEIDERLRSIAKQEGIRYLLAVESGSRAWGFPSPDSDFDVRFIYCRSRNEYLSLFPKPDVIERPIVDEIDLAGWDIRKALGLLLKHNAVLSEWIDSPIRYLPDDPVVADLAGLCARNFNPRGYARHYASLGQKSYAAVRSSDGGVPVKKLFYALRPALAIRALRIDPASRPAMNLQRLVAKCELPLAIEAQIAALVAQKAKTREAGVADELPEITALILNELGRAEEVAERDDREAFAAEAEELFLRLVS